MAPHLMVVLLAGACCVVPAVAAGPLKPPVVHEVFTLLPCPKSPSARDSTIGMEGCQEHTIVASDKKIDLLAKEIFGQLADNAARRRFLSGEKAWLAYRGAVCNSRSDIFEGGTGAATEYAGCVVSIDAQHVVDLTEFHQDLGPH